MKLNKRKTAAGAKARKVTAKRIYEAKRTKRTKRK